MVAAYVRTLNEFDSDPILPLISRPPGVYEQPVMIKGNSLLSTVFVESADVGASVKVDWWDATTGKEVGEEYLLGGHDSISTSGIISRETVTRIHNMPIVRATVSGGNAKFSVYITVVSSFASDLDAALQKHLEIIDFARDKALPIVTWDTTTDKWVFLQSTAGKLQVDVPGVIQTNQQAINFRRYNQTPAMAKGAPTVHVDYTVPAGYRLFWLAGSGSADSWVKWTVDIAGVRWLTKRSAFDKPDVKLHLDSPLILTAGQRIIITAENIGDFGTAADVETFFFGSLEAV